MPTLGISVQVIVTICLCVLSFDSFAAEAKEPQWYEVATGILAIPAALIGLAYSYLLIKKTRLEARKTELEIAEKELALRQLPQQPNLSTATELSSGQFRLMMLLIVRFVVLYLILTVWGLFEDFFELVFAGIYIGAQKLLSISLDGWAIIPLVVLQKLPKVVYWLIFFGLGWPLFKDANAVLGIDIKEFLKVSKLSELHKHGSTKDV